MRNANGWLLGGLVVVLGWCVACEPKVRSLGDEGTAGSGGEDGGATAKGGASAKGGATAKGGASAKGGDTSGTISTGPVVVDRTAYPLNPTLPIDPTCKCASPDEICNAANVCVPRCDSEGHCALWLTSHAVADLFIEGTTVYYTTGSGVDADNNWLGNASLYRVDYPDGTPKLIATDLGYGTTIIGRYNGVTYLNTNFSLNFETVKVTDAGVMTQVVAGTAKVYGDSLLYGHPDGRLMRRNLATGTPAEVLVDCPSKPGGFSCGWMYVLKDYIWYHGTNQYEEKASCSMSLGSIAAGPTCIPLERGVYATVVDASDELVFAVLPLERGYVSVSPTTGQVVNTIYSGKLYGPIEYASGSLYGVAQSGTSFSLVRVPTAAERLPQEVLPTSIVQPFGPPDRTMEYAVGSPGIFWAQWSIDPSMNQGQYIFHSVLPPQPCDAELYCPVDRYCSNGFCVKQI